MNPKQTEYCGRCSMTSVVGMTQDGTDRRDRDPFTGPRIEVPEDELRAVMAPAVFLSGVKRRIDEVATRLTYGKQ